MRTIHDRSTILGRFAILFIVIIGMIGLLAAMRVSASETQRVGDFSGSTATVSNTSATLGEVLTYTLVARNSSAVTSPYVYAGQMLTNGQTFISAEVVSVTNAAQLGFVQNSAGITWTGTISPSGVVTLSLRVTVAADFNGAAIENTFKVQSGFNLTERPTVVRVGQRGIVYFPYLAKAPNAPTLNAITGSDDGTYDISWVNNETVSGVIFVLEESTSADFSAGVTTIYSGTNTTHQVTGKTGGTFYYRVRALIGTSYSSYSNIQSAIVTTFAADRTTLTVGECTTLRWDFINIKAATVKLGFGYDFIATNGQGFATVCPAVTTTYQLKITEQNDSVTTHEETITVGGTGCSTGTVDPYVNKFQSSKYTVTGNETIQLSWDVQCASSIQLWIDHGNDGTINATHNVVGVETSRNEVPPSTTRYILRVNRMNSTGLTTYIETSFVVVRN